VAALRRSHELNVYTPDTEVATRRLAALRPDENNGLTERIPAMGFMAPAVYRAGFEESE
jgi:hypothetical protein